MLKEFRDFAMRGSVIDLAVGVIIGGAFGKIVASLVGDILMPLIGLMMGGVNFADLTFTFRGAEIKYGVFTQNIVDFIIIAFVIFLMVRAMNRLKKPAPAAEPTIRQCPYCDTAISIKAKRCPNCTSQL
jgi:large conductance mechanosensitive channel